jgi:dipeptidyl aminopeptidase/acylaminoacyl peptidase
VDYLRTLPHVDPARIGIIGWSHGGFIAAHALFRNRQPFRSGSAIVPVTNLVFRLSYKGPAYQRQFAAQTGIQGLPFERRAEYIRRSPVYFVDNLRVPMLVHVATNDDDVDFVENEQMINALRAKKPELAETRVYLDPPGGHSFSLLMDPRTLQPRNTAAQRDSWTRVWTFFERTLRPADASTPTNR